MCLYLKQEMFDNRTLDVSLKQEMFDNRTTHWRVTFSNKDTEVAVKTIQLLTSSGQIQLLSFINKPYTET